MVSRLATIVITGLILTGCHTTNQNAGPPILGGIIGGLAGSVIGSGSGNIIATAVGAGLGVLGGSHLTEHNQSPVYIMPSSQCSHHTNSGVRAACERGVSERNEEIQRKSENKAYTCARYGRC